MSPAPCATLTVIELAQMIGVNPKTAYEYLYHGKIPARKIGSRWIISRKQVTEWLKSAQVIPIAKRHYNESESSLVKHRGKMIRKPER